MRFLLPLLLALGLQNVVGEYTPEALADQIDWASVPGGESLSVKGKFNMFSGYITVDEDNGRRIFYWFMEAQDDPSSAPVMLWSNGGPGCSGMLGLLTEHGPFEVRDGGNTLVDNDYAWNKLANMLYVEVPSGVGFSYSDTPDDYKTGDDATAVDNYWFIQGWLNRFPQYRSNPFHLSSESYGGHYVPELAEQIVKRNAEGFRKINFVGFMVGNPFTEAHSNQVAQYQAFWGKQLVPKPVFDKWWEACANEGYGYESDPDCEELEDQMDRFLGHINPYALDYPMCAADSSVTAMVGGKAGSGSRSTIARSQRLRLRDFARRALKRKDDTSGSVLRGHLTEHPTDSIIGDYEPCAEDYTTPYLNRADVQEALHVKQGTKWEQCSTKVDYNISDMLRPMMPYYKRLLDGKHAPKILVFSGDDDAVCATEGTQWWIFDLGYDVDAEHFWKPWEEAGQVAGYATRFEEVDLAFVTVHYAGHEVPAYQPARAFELLRRYFEGSWHSDETSSPILSATMRRH